MRSTEEVLNRLNDYTGDNIWQDVILQDGIIAFDEEATAAIDPSHASDRFVLVDGTIIRWDAASGQWYEAGEYAPDDEADTEEPTRGSKLPPHPDDIRAALSEAGQRLFEARRAHQDAMLDIAHWLKAGDEQGLPIKGMCKLANITRRTAYKILEKAK